MGFSVPQEAQSFKLSTASDNALVTDTGTYSKNGDSFANLVYIYAPFLTGEIRLKFNYKSTNGSNAAHYQVVTKNGTVLASGNTTNTTDTAVSKDIFIEAYDSLRIQVKNVNASYGCTVKDVQVCGTTTDYTDAQVAGV